MLHYISWQGECAFVIISTMNKLELPYVENVVDMFEHFAPQPHAMLLHSCRAHQFKQRFSLFTAAPKVIMTVQGNLTTVSKNGNHATSTLDPFDLFKQQFDELNAQSPHIAMGYLSYDLAQRIHPLQHKTIADITLPTAVIGFYDWKITLDHHTKKCWLVCNHAETQAKIKNLLRASPAPQTPFKITKQFQTNMSYDTYAKAFHQIQQHIHAGDCYQANLCQRYTATYQGSPWQAYKQLQAKNPAPFSAYINLEHGAILSCSPERFLRMHDGTVETKPIKGTAARYNNPLQDRHAAQQLINSTKDRAENLMIVDLLRNDLGKSCQAGTIKVPKLFQLESFPNVHHLVSTITGQLKPNQHAIDVLRACFPGGSITGAPKLSAMQIIENLEPHHRSVYCGTIFYLDANGTMDSNIAIRTVICNDHQAHCYAGGAIVADSTLADEHQEAKIKVSQLIALLENL